LLQEILLALRSARRPCDIACSLSHRARANAGGESSGGCRRTIRPSPDPPDTAPRLKIGQPDLQGFWHDTTLTKMTRPAGVSSLVYSEAEVAKLEQEMADEIEEASAPTAADAPAEYVIPKDIKPEYLAGGGATGRYNRFWIDPGNHVMRVNGQPRSSIVATPTGTAPPRKAGATPAPAPEPPAFVKLLGPTPPRGQSFDNPESRATERCIVSFGRNAGPPMFANGFYNNSYQIVQLARSRPDRDGDGA